MAITLEDVQREIARRQSQSTGPQPQSQGPAGVSMQDVQTELARRGDGGTTRREELLAGPGGEPPGLPSVAETAVQEAFPTTLMGPDVAGSTAGEVIGGGLGTLAGPAAPVAVPVGAAIGAGTGLLISRWLQNEPVTAQEVTGEALTSVIPEAVTQAGRGILRASQAARRARFSDLADQVRRETGTVFEAPEREAVGALFRQVSESGVRVDVGSIQRHLGSVGGQYDDLLREVRSIDRATKSGGEFTDLVSRLQAGQRGAYDIGRLQSLHSEIGKHMQRTNLPHEAKETLRGLADSVDDSIFNSLARGQNAAQADSVRSTLRTARAGWAKIRRTEELQKIVEMSVDSIDSGMGVKVNLDRIRDRVRKGVGREGKSILRTFEHDPQAKKRFYDFLDRIAPNSESINVSLADLPPHTLGQVAGKLGEWMATIYTSTAGREAFENLMISGQGKFTHSTIANLANVARRELERAGEERRPSLTPTTP